KDVIFGLVGAIGLSWIFRAVGLFPQAGIVAMAFVAAVGAVIPIVAQRKFWPTESAGEEKADKWWRWGLGAAVVAVVGWMTRGPNRPSSSLPTAASGSIQGRKRPRPWTWSFPPKPSRRRG